MSGFLRVAGVALVVFIILVVFLLPSDSPAAPNTYRIATVAWIGWSPLHVAQQKGFWSRQGIKVQVINYDDPTIILEAIKTKRIDFAMDMAGSLVGVYLSGTPLVILAETNWSHGGDKIIVKAASDLRDLVGQPLGVFLNLPSCLYFLGLYLEEQNLRLTQFRVVEIGSQDLAAQFVAGRIPAMVNYEPWSDWALKRTKARVLASSDQYPGCIPECLWTYRKRFAQIPASDIIKIIKGWIEAMLWIKNPANWKEYTRILNQKTFKGHRTYSEAELRSMLSKVRIHGIEELMRRNRTGGGLETYLAKLKDFLQRNQLLGNGYQAADILDNRYIMQALKDYPSKK